MEYFFNMFTVEFVILNSKIVFFIIDIQCDETEKKNYKYIYSLLQIRDSFYLTLLHYFFFQNSLYLKYVYSVMDCMFYYLFISIITRSICI